MFGLTSKYSSFRPKAISQHGSELQQNNDDQFNNNKISGPKTYKTKMNVLKGINE